MLEKDKNLKNYTLMFIKTNNEDLQHWFVVTTMVIFFSVLSKWRNSIDAIENRICSSISCHKDTKNTTT